LSYHFKFGAFFETQCICPACSVIMQ